ncbi:MAG: Na(+)-translocating NADH-quinone reductase subunit C [Planctomycetaceae bacterium]|nr:Na(+)-translocating NADH-quinone reductase subunit C [Planctomycetaceae bacterium]
MSDRDSLKNTFLVAFVLCLVCSLIVSGAAIGLRPIKERNERISFQREVLSVAGLYEKGKNTADDIPELFKQIKTAMIDLETGEITDAVSDPDSFKLKDVSKKPELTIKIPADQDIAGIKRREKYTKIYLLTKEDGQIDQLILTVRGKGLWSTMWGLLSLDGDLKTVRGLTFYEHGETPGLGGEIVNPKWKAKWSNPECPKILFDEQGEIKIAFYKGVVSCDMPDSQHKFDGLAGATITTRGVQDMFKFWLGEQGYGPLLQKIKEGQFPVTELSNK